MENTLCPNVSRAAPCVIVFIWVSRLRHCYSELINIHDYCSIIWPGRESRLYLFPLKTKARCFHGLFCQEFAPFVIPAFCTLLCHIMHPKSWNIILIPSISSSMIHLQSYNKASDKTVCGSAVFRKTLEINVFAFHHPAAFTSISRNLLTCHYCVYSPIPFPANIECLLSLFIFTYRLFFCPQAGSPIIRYQKPPWGQKPGARTHLLFLFPPSANQRITRCLCVWLASSLCLKKNPAKTLKNIPVKATHSRFFFFHCCLYEKNLLSWYTTELNSIQFASVLLSAVTHAHHMFLRSCLPVIVHYKDLLINTTN